MSENGIRPAATFVVVLLTLMLQSCERGSLRISQPEKEMKEAIMLVLDGQVKAWNESEIEGFMAGYHKSPDIVFTSGGVIRRGWQTVLDNYKSSYAQESMGRLSFGDLEITLFGQEAALVVGKWVLEGRDDNPDGVFTLVFIPTPEGWRIIHDHTSSSAAEAE